MNTNLDLKSLRPAVKKIRQKVYRHITFAAVIMILLAYLLVVVRISQLSSAEPSDDGSPTAASTIPKINKEAIKQIQELEQNSPEVRSLFNQARNNPFQE